MTTIACNRNEIAADGKITANDSILRTRRKIERIGDCIVGTAGTVRNGDLFTKWYRDGGVGKLPKLTSDFEALVLAPSGIFTFDCECGVMEIEEDWHAIGSGSQAARTMLSLGHSPTEAVRKAIELDNLSGPPIVILKLK